ncbi:hypothetical protein HYN43_005455 [Mucilaginibacter celer]|uniref:Uncharacterized protein n=2 Tax=Mucilaginibacter celer TaxID=2305508 RepID=A0A494VTQ7_9SPHI|nr:hypothetical protein HYN43_005455 [Mucilaginibacter celer]
MPTNYFTINKIKNTMKKFILIAAVALSAGALSSATNKKENNEQIPVAKINSLASGFKRDLGSAD